MADGYEEIRRDLLPQTSGQKGKQYAEKLYDM